MRCDDAWRKNVCFVVVFNVFVVALIRGEPFGKPDEDAVVTREGLFVSHFRGRVTLYGSSLTALMDGEIFSIFQKSFRAVNML